MTTIEGRRPVLEALRAGRAVSEVLVVASTKRAAILEEIRDLATERGVPVREVDRAELEARAVTPSPQGVLAVTEGFAYVEVDDVLDRVPGDEVPLLVALDGLTDPHNVGAIARSAEAAGAHGLVLPVRRSAPVTAVVEKSAAGALNHLPVARVTNLGRALAELSRRGLWIVALDADGTQEVFALELATEPLCLVVGSEGRGVSRLVGDRADVRAAIPMGGRIASLNASAAAAVALFEIRRQRGPG